MKSSEKGKKVGERVSEKRKHEIKKEKEGCKMEERNDERKKSEKTKKDGWQNALKSYWLAWEINSLSNFKCFCCLRLDALKEKFERDVLNFSGNTHLVRYC